MYKSVGTINTFDNDGIPLLIDRSPSPSFERFCNGTWGGER